MFRDRRPTVSWAFVAHSVRGRRQFASRKSRLRSCVLAMGWAAPLWASCSVLVDADRAQCSSNADCRGRGAAFAESVCIRGECRPPSGTACGDGGTCASDTSAARADACSGTRCQDASHARDARADSQDDAGSPAEPDAQAMAPAATEDAQTPAARECSVDGDCAALGKAGALCVDGVCWQTADTKQCTADADCSGLGPEFAGGMCISAQCRPNPRWRCEPPADASSFAPLTLHALVRDSLSLSPLSGVRASVCQKLDLDCVTPVTQATTGRDGQLTFQVPHDLAGYLRIEDSRFFPALYFLPAVLPSDGQLDPVPLLDVGVVDALALSIGSDIDPQRGHMMLIAEDCLGAALAGVTFKTPQQDAATIQFYVRDLLPTTSATETDDIGNGGYLNFPAGSAVIDVTKVDLNLKLTTSSVVVRPSFITVAYIRPDLR
ncbi:MAG TPA: hypothetical protein VG963_21740 [Polyangiaceae bacterium]|nr:hypothetical protein [Polyangiaceae bacterium]